MIKRRECEEIVKDTDAGNIYRFAGTFGFISALSFAGRDPALIFADLADGSLPPDEIKNVLMYSVEELNGSPVADADREAVATELIERAGLVDCALIARMMMSHAMNGAIKKKALRESETIQSIIQSPNRSRWKIFASVGFVLAGSLSGLIALLCTMFSI